jgi:hypothetical protein
VIVSFIATLHLAPDAAARVASWRPYHARMEQHFATLSFTTRGRGLLDITDAVRHCVTAGGMRNGLGMLRW